MEVTELSLLLKALEGKSDQPLISQMKLFHERVLPGIDRNIQCCNSLIGPDFYDGQLALDDEAAQYIERVRLAGCVPADISNPSNPLCQRGASHHPLCKRGWSAAEGDLMR